MTEINVTSPTGIQEVRRFGGADIATLIWDAIEQDKVLTPTMIDFRQINRSKTAAPPRSAGWIPSTLFPLATITIPPNESFGALRVINEDWIAGGAGFRPIRHRDMEIVTYHHRRRVAAQGFHRRRRRHPARRNPAHERGLRASSMPNSTPARDRHCHLLQIWIMPSRPASSRPMSRRRSTPKRWHNNFARIAAPDPRANEVRLVQDAEIWAAKLDAGVEAIHPLPGRKAWLQVAKGEVSVGEERLKAGDAAAITDHEQISCARAPSEVLLFDLACFCHVGAPALARQRAAHAQVLFGSSDVAVQGELFHQAEAALVARVDSRKREVDEDIGGAELPVDHRAVADAAARAHIALQQRRQAAQPLPGIDRVLRHPVHVHIELRRAPAPASPPAWGGNGADRTAAAPAAPDRCRQSDAQPNIRSMAKRAT